MGFGIRVPGVRVSTRGVRVGIGRASVGVSTRGSFSASVGSGRVSAGRSGVTGSVGVGPVRLGSRGVSVSGGVGPVFGSISHNSVSSGLGAGPIWVNGRIKARRMSRSKTPANDPQAFSDAQIDSPTNKRDIDYHLGSSDVHTDGIGGRRNSQQILNDAVDAICLLVHPLTIPFRDFQISKPSMPTELQMESWSLNWATEIAASRKVIPNLSEHTLFNKTDSDTKKLMSNETSRLLRKLDERKLEKQDDVKIQDLSSLPDWAPLWSYSFYLDNPILHIFILWCIGVPLGVYLEMPFGVLPQIPWILMLLRFAKRKRQVKKVVSERMTQINSEYKHDREKIFKEVQKNLRAKQVRFDRKKDEITSNGEVLRLKAVHLEEQQALIKYLSKTYDRFVDGDPIVSTIVLQAAFVDNGGDCAPLGIDEGDLLVACIAPQIDEVIWPETHQLIGYLGVKKKTIRQKNSEYHRYLRMQALGTAREAFAVQPVLKRVQVAILDNGHSYKDFESRIVVGTLTVEKSDMDIFDLSTNILQKRFGVENEIIERWLAVTSNWSASQEGIDGKYLRLIEQWSRENRLNYLQEFLGLIDQIVELFASKFDFFPTSDLKRKPLFSDLYGSKNRPIGYLEESENELEYMYGFGNAANNLDFWCLCGLMADFWVSENVNFDELKEAAEIVSGLCHPFYESDIEWNRPEVPDERVIESEISTGKYNGQAMRRVRSRDMDLSDDGKHSAGPFRTTGNADDDELILLAMDLVIRSRQGSSSMLQRELGIGFARSNQILDLLESRGVVGPSDGSFPREVLMSIEELEKLQ